MGKWKKGLAAVLAGVLLFSTVAVSQNDFGKANPEKEGRLPIMGWSSWNLYQGDVSEADIQKQAEALKRTGLADKGYTYVLLDDGALATERDESGNLQPNEKFPNGFKALGDYLHDQKLKFGMQNSAGTKTGSGLPGSYNYEMRDAQTYADWGVDLLKYVFCNNPLVTKPLDSIMGEINGMGPEAPAINRIVIKEVKDGVSTYIKTVHISSDNTAISGGASFDQIPEYMTGLDAKEDLSMAGTGTLTFNMEKVDPLAKYTVDVYCFNSDKPRWLSVQVNPQTENKYNKFYLKSDITGDQADTDAVSRSIYDVPLQEGENKISFYLDKNDVKEAYRQDAIRSFAAMDKAIDATGRDMLLSVCDWGWNEPHTGWGKEIAHYWRTTADMTRTKGKVEWSSNNGQNGLSVLGVYEKNVVLDEFAGSFGYNDPDALAVGLEGLTEEQNRSHFTLWCMMAAPLFLSADLTKIDPSTLAIVGNEDIIALDQDELCLQARRFKQVDNMDYLVKPLADGSVALCIFNKGETEQAASVSMKDVTKAVIEKAEDSKLSIAETQMTLFTDVFANSEAYTSKDLWSEETGEIKPDENISVSVPASGVKVFKLAPAVEQEVSVKITQAPEAVERGAQAEFKATVTGAKNDNTVTWAIESTDFVKKDGTCIDENGVLTIAADEELKEITVKATSVADLTKSATATVKVIDATKPSVVSVDELEPIKIDEGTAFDKWGLPETVGVQIIENGKTETRKIKVIWKKPAELLTAGKYEIFGELQIDEELYNPANIKAKQPLYVNPIPHVLTVEFNNNIAELEVGNAEDVSPAGIYKYKIMGGKSVSLQFTPRDSREFAKAFVRGEARTIEEADSFTYDYDMPGWDTTVFVGLRVVDKAALREAVDGAEEIQSRDKYKKEAKQNNKTFEKTLKEAKKILQKIDTNQMEVDEICQTLFRAMGDMKLEPSSLLKNLLSAVEKLPSYAYSDLSWGDLKEIMSEARISLEEGGGPEKLMDAYRSLCTSFAAREYQAKLTHLTKPLEKAQKIQDQLEDYKEEGKENFLRAFTNALSMDVVNTQEEVDAATIDLNKAMRGMEQKEVEDRLASLIQKAKSLNLNDYDSASRTRLSKALDEASKALDSGATDEEMEQACKALKEALANLKEYKKPDRPKKDRTPNPMTYGDGTARVDVPALIAAQAVQAPVSVRSDTTIPFVLKRGKAYCFKMTVLDGRTEIPSFTVGNSSVLKTQFVAQAGSDCYFRVWAVGEPGQGTGVYTAMPGEFPQLKCLVTVG